MPYLRPRFFRNPQMMNKRAIRRTMPSVDASLSYINWPTTKGEACLIPKRQRRTSICTDAFTSSSDACRPGRGMFATLLPLRSSRAPLLALRLPFLSEIRPADLAADVTRLALLGLFSPAAERALIGATLFTTHLMLFYHSSIFRIDLPSGTILVVT